MPETNKNGAGSDFNMNKKFQQLPVIFQKK